MRHSNSLEHNTYKLRAPIITQYVRHLYAWLYGWISEKKMHKALVKQRK